MSRPAPTTVTMIAALSLVMAGGVRVTSLTAQDRVVTLLAQVRAALGGDAALAGVNAISAEGPYKRVVGTRTRESTLTLLIVRPDKLRRAEESRFFTTTERITTFDGTQVWDDVVTSGAGVGGGGHGGGFDHGSGGHAPDGGGSGDHGGWDHDGEHGDADSQADALDATDALTSEQRAAARVRRTKMELQRWALTFFADADRPFTSAGRVESPDGPADMLETTDEAGRPVRYVLDPTSHLPLMVQYQQVRLAAAGRAQRAAPGPATTLATVTMHLSAFTKMDGVMMPHQIDISVDGRATEAWTIESLKINPKIKPGTFKKPVK